MEACPLLSCGLRVSVHSFVYVYAQMHAFLFLFKFHSCEVGTGKPVKLHRCFLFLACPKKKKTQRNHNDDDKENKKVSKKSGKACSS